MLDESKIQGTPEWHELRRNSIGASDAAAILGVSPWKSRYELWNEKVGNSAQEEPSYAMRRGAAMEPQALEEYQKHCEAQFFPEVVFHEKYPFIMASLDGMSLDGTQAVEIKCPGKETHALALQGKVPDHYYAQLQHQMMVTGLQDIDYFSFDGEEGVIVKVQRDQEYIDNLLEKELEFWKLVKGNIPPEITEKDYISMDEDQAWLRLSEELKSIDRDIKQLEEKRDVIKKVMIELSEGCNCKGNGITLTRSMRKGVVNYKKIPQLKGVDLEQFRGNSVETWVLRVN